MEQTLIALEQVSCSGKASGSSANGAAIPQPGPRGRGYGHGDHCTPQQGAIVTKPRQRVRFGSRRGIIAAFQAAFRLVRLFPGRYPGLRNNGPLGLLMYLASLRYKNLLMSFLREQTKKKERIYDRVEVISRLFKKS